MDTTFFHQTMANFATYVDDLVVLTSTPQATQIQLDKIYKFCKWTGMDLGTSKCAFTS